MVLKWIWKSETGAYPRNNLPKIKDGAYVINLDEFKSIGTCWIALHVNAEIVTYYYNIPKEIRKLVGNKNVKTNIYRIQVIEYIQ